jgi:hypothetical protein
VNAFQLVIEIVDDVNALVVNQFPGINRNSIVHFVLLSIISLHLNRFITIQVDRNPEHI